MNWFDCLEAFMLVAEKRSFTAASRLMSCSSSAVTKRIQWLEGQLETDLLIRTTRRVQLTEKGQYFLQRIRPLMHSWQDIHTELLDYDDNPSGELAIASLPIAAACEWYTECFHQFLDKYPQIRVHLLPIHEPFSMADKGVDLFIGYDHYVLEQANTITQNLHTRQLQCYASPNYLQQHGTPQHYKELSQHNCIIYREDNIWSFDDDEITVSGNYRTESGYGLIHACCLGLGIMYIPSFLVEKEVSLDKLVPILTNHRCRSGYIKLYHQRFDYRPRKISIAIDFIKKYFQS